MILCVSLNPCLEVNIEVDSLAVGRTHKVISKHTYLTGKALNIAVGIKRLGADSIASGFMHEENGRLFEQELHREGVTYKFVWNRGKVREVYKFIDYRSMLTEIVDEATPIEDVNLQTLVNTVADLASKCKAVVISGGCTDSLPSGYMERILSAVPEKVIKVIDTDGDKLVNLLSYGVDLVKPNLDELQKALGVKITDKDSMIRACDTLVLKGAKRVLLSLGKNGAVITDGKRHYYCTSLNVAMNSTAGAGDAMVAAAAKALSEGADIKEILKCGVAAGTAAVTLPDTISFRREKYEEIVPALIVKEI